jgi:protocadherin delta 1
VLTSRLQLDSGPCSLILEAFDGGKPTALTGSATILVHVQNASHHVPTFQEPVATVKVREDFPSNEPIFIVQAFYKDRSVSANISYVLEPASELQYGQIFQLHCGTGELYLRQSLDYEREAEYRLTVLAIDSGVEPLTSHQMIVVQVSDVNDNAPLVTINTLEGAGSRSAKIVENADVGSFVGHISVYDADSGSSGQVTCQLDAVSSATFHLGRLVAGEYKLTTLRQLDYETESLLTVNIICSDDGEPSPLTTDVNVTVHVVDMNENSPQFVQSSYSISLPENNVVGVFLLQVKAVDADTGRNGEIRYEIRPDSNNNVSRFVHVDDQTGNIRLSSSLDHETSRQITFVVIARDGGDRPLSAAAEVTINVENINDEKPVFMQPSYNFIFTENSPSGYVIGNVRAVDPDMPPFNRFVYMLVDAYSTGITERLTIDSRSGSIVARASFDREMQDKYVFSVTAIDEDLPIFHSEVLVTVHIDDVNDNLPMFEFPAENNRTFHIPSAVPVGFLVFRVTASDRDIGPNARLVYQINSFEDDNDMFLIDSATGVLRTSANFAGITYRTFQLLITVTDSGFPPRRSTTVVHIVVDSSIRYTNSGDSMMLGSFLVDSLPLVIVVLGVRLILSLF